MFEASQKKEVAWAERYKHHIVLYNKFNGCALAKLDEYFIEEHKVGYVSGNKPNPLDSIYVYNTNDYLFKAFNNPNIEIEATLINKYTEKEVVWKKMDKNYTDQIRNYNQYVENCNRIYNEQRMLINRGKWQKWLFLAAGIGGGILLHR